MAGCPDTDFASELALAIAYIADGSCAQAFYGVPASLVGLEVGAGSTRRGEKGN